MTGKPVIGVVGLGAMGLGIAQVFAQAGHAVVATDANEPARQSAKTRMAEALSPRVEAGKLTAEARDAMLARVTVAESMGAFAPTALVVEAVIEKLDVKQQLFAGIERVVSDDCVLATNTSSLPVATIMRGLQHKQRGLGLHFFNPVPAMKLVELVATPDASDQALALARDLAAGLGKTVFTCADTPGFIVNRCARPFYGEALALLEEGRSASDIDAAMLQAGYRLGPFSLIDLVGADINLAATQGLHEAMAHHPRYHVFEALKAQAASGNLGRKSGRGFLFPEKPGAAPGDAAAIVLRIEAALANEAASLLGSSKLGMDDIDTAVKLGLNFPRGPFEAARAHGLAKVRATLQALEAAAPAALKGRYVISPALEALS